MFIEDGKIIINNIDINLFRKIGYVFSKFSFGIDILRKKYIKMFSWCCLSCGVWNGFKRFIF